MSAKEKTFNVINNLSTKREKIVERIMNLSDEQFEQLLTLYRQQDPESCQACPTPHQTSA